MSHRKQQVESSLQRAVADVIERDLSDPRVRGLISVTRVEMTDDLKSAFAYVSILPDKYERRTLAGLNAAARHIMSRVDRRVQLRSMPRLEFRLDPSIKKQAEVEDAIREGLSREAAGSDADHQES